MAAQGSIIAHNARAIPPQRFFRQSNVPSAQNNFLSGITLPKLLSLLHRHRRLISLWRLHRIVFLLTIATFQSLIAIAEDLFYKKSIDAIMLSDQPAVVFIIGHPRTGTTHLHNLLAQDSERFGYLSTLAAGFPSTFLTIERLSMTWILAGLVDRTRPMDNMKLSFELPQEDEIYMCARTGGLSAYMYLVFMTEFATFESYFDLRGLPQHEVAAYRDEFIRMVKKIQYHQKIKDGGRTLILKSPTHTAKIPFLLDIFPHARFIYIHRNPYDVFRSSMHMANTYYGYCYLNEPSTDDIRGFVIRQYQLLFDRYMRSRDALLSEGRLIEVAFADLDTSPADVVEGIYAHFGWEGAEEVRERVQGYMGSLGAFKKNSFAAIDREDIAIVNSAWRDSFRIFGYDMLDASA